MMISFSVDYDFEELQLCDEGLMANGTATLVHDGDGEFYVDEVVLIGGKRLDRKGTGAWGFPSLINKALFEAVATLIENDSHAQDFFQNALEEGSAPDPDRAYDERRDHAAMGLVD
ncbi:hypothetical protein [Sinorhizobium meliloti]|uniref:hypothetical protein n=1 Tax=Rhizobium meliloti TaxID=382 RepID=UPI0012AA2B9C|nr:hypothetical protein [Sinorhizobium meliloti]QGJ74719.1 hypothetical protein C3L21_12440 [Sinorhizobium meliloti]